MRKTREVLRLKWALGLSARQAAGSAAVARSTVSECLRRAAAAGLTWAQVEALSDAQLEARLYPPPPRPAAGARPLPDWQALHDELKGKGVTRFRLWEEYRESCPEGYAYSHFCELYRAWRRQFHVVMRQDHKAGEKLFTDWAGDTVPIVDPESGEVRPAYLFVAVLGASNYTYVEAALSQDSEVFLAAHVRAFEFYGGCARILVPDYVPRHIVAVMCPLALCGRTAAVVGVCAPLPALAATRSSEGSEPFEEGWVVARYYSSEAVDDLKANAAMPQHDNLDSATAGRRHHLPEALRLCAHLSPAGPQPRHVLGAAAT